jgi:D-alanyl-D-alanine carboxypeptidase (penicillin-binding protein 5/6)
MMGDDEEQRMKNDATDDRQAVNDAVATPGPGAASELSATPATGDGSPRAEEADARGAAVATDGADRAADSDTDPLAMTVAVGGTPPRTDGPSNVTVIEPGDALAKTVSVGRNESSAAAPAPAREEATNSATDAAGRQPARTAGDVDKSLAAPEGDRAVQANRADTADTADVDDDPLDSPMVLPTRDTPAADALASAPDATAATVAVLTKERGDADEENPDDEHRAGDDHGDDHGDGPGRDTDDLGDDSNDAEHAAADVEHAEHDTVLASDGRAAALDGADLTTAVAVRAASVADTNAADTNAADTNAAAAIAADVRSDDNARPASASPSPSPSEAEAEAVVASDPKAANSSDGRVAWAERVKWSEETQWPSRPVRTDSADPAGDGADRVRSRSGQRIDHVPTPAQPDVVITDDDMPGVAPEPFGVMPGKSTITKVRRKRWPFLVAVLVVLLAFAGYAAARAYRAYPAPTAEVTLNSAQHLAGSTPALDWSSEGQSALSIPSLNYAATSGPVNTPQSIASVTKVMTAYLVLRDHPLRLAIPGPTLTVSQAQASTMAQRLAEDQSVLNVPAGYQLSEFEALEALMLPSADNVADMLAEWDAGSVPAFVAKMNATAASLGMTHTHYVDASGFATGSSSTATDQLVLARQAMADPVFAQIVGEPSAQLPVVGTITNYNTLIGSDGVDGIKTGSTTPAGGCLLFAATEQVGGEQVVVYGAVFGQHGGGDVLAAGLAASKSLISSLTRNLRDYQVLPAGAVVGQLRSAYGSSVPIVTTAPLSAVGMPGTAVTVTVKLNSDGTGTLSSSTGQTIPVRPNGTLPGPTLSDRLHRVF